MKVSDNILLIFVLVFISIFILLLIFKKKFNRHRFNQKKSKSVLSKIQTFESHGSIISYLRKVNPFVFEEIILDCFEQKKWRVVRNKRYTGDGGSDGRVISSDNKQFLIQAKRYSGYINPKHINDFNLAIIRDKKATSGFFIHTGKTGGLSKKITSQLTNVEIISGTKLVELIKQ